MNTKCEYPVVDLGVLSPNQLPVSCSSSSSVWQLRAEKLHVLKDLIKTA